MSNDKMIEEHHRLNDPPKYDVTNEQPPIYPNPNIAYGPAPMMAQPQTNITLVVHQVPISSLRDQPAQVTCPNCRGFILTKIRYESGVAAWLVSVGLCVFGCGFCFCIPFCVDGCKDVVHSCPNCRAFVGRYKRI